MNCSTTIIRSASMCLYPLKYCHLELDQEFSVFNARSGVTYGLGCQKKGLGFQCDPFNYVNESTMSGFVGAYRDELSALPFLNRSVDDIQQWQLDVNHLVSEKCPDSCSAQLCSSLFVQLVVNLNQLSIPIAGNTGGSDQEDVPDIRMILLVLAGGLIMGVGALLFYLKLPLVNCMSGTKSDVGPPLISDPEAGGAPVEPNADGDGGWSHQLGREAS